MKWTAICAFAIPLTACTQGAPSGPSTQDIQGSCEALVAAETGVRPEEVNAISTQPDPTGTTTTVSVGGAQAPWLCYADSGGVVTGVEYSQEG